MSPSEPARSPSGRPGSTILAAAVVVTATLIIGVTSCQPTDQPPASSPSTTTPQGDDHGPPSQPEQDTQRRTAAPTLPRTTALSEADGALPDGVTVFDGEYPGVARLDDDLLRALRDAATAAADDDIEFVVNSGWRSPEYQDQLLRDAISQYGSQEQAARWVATPDTSFHVTGDAVDIGPSEATSWLSEHGAEYGLCQIYANEPWHYELRPEAVDDGCPPAYDDPTHDPRTQQ